ncbi:hypothetical protein, partial [Providencia rustigianii]|uniref:hypothetical protein n=1 Tax=Providencia rustigianii TaxID=158850 RepID=UPI0022409836
NNIDMIMRINISILIVSLGVADSYSWLIDALFSRGVYAKKLLYVKSLTASSVLLRNITL